MCPRQASGSPNNKTKNGGGLVGRPDAFVNVPGIIQFLNKPFSPELIP
jgi:hypothetical protein